jgi:DNA replication protein DnaC
MQWHKPDLKLKIHNEGVEKLVDCVNSWCRAVWENSRNGKHSQPLLVIGGNPGIGKTHCLKRIWAWHRVHAFRMMTYEGPGWRRPPSIVFYDWTSVAECPQDTYATTSDDIFAASVAMLDDVGTEVDQYKSGVPTARLERILGGRERMFTVITTNIRSELWQARWSHRVQDRLLRHSTVVELFGVPSYAAQS